MDWNNTRPRRTTIDGQARRTWARVAIDHFRKWNAYVVPVRSCWGRQKRAFFAGDTALTDSFDRVGPVDLAIFGIGAYDPWHDATPRPEQAWAMFQAWAPGVRRCTTTFRLSEEPLGEPMCAPPRAGPDADRTSVPRSVRAGRSRSRHRP